MRKIQQRIFWNDEQMSYFSFHEVLDGKPSKEWRSLSRLCLDFFDILIFNFFPSNYNPALEWKVFLIWDLLCSWSGCRCFPDEVDWARNDDEHNDWTEWNELSIREIRQVSDDWMEWRLTVVMKSNQIDYFHFGKFLWRSMSRSTEWFHQITKDIHQNDRQDLKRFPSYVVQNGRIKML